MFTKRFRITLLSVIVGASLLVSLLIVSCTKLEHPNEHPEDRENGAALTKDQLADAIEAYANKTAAAHGGHFLAVDDITGKELKLTLDKVHRTRLSRVGKDHYFACADFKTPEGKIYDLDVFMKGADKDHLTFSDFSIHKEDGKERYTWYEEGDIWKKKPVGEGREHSTKPHEEHSDERHEHPEAGSTEHPQ